MQRLPLAIPLCSIAALVGCQQPQPAPADNAAEEPVLNLPSVPAPRPPIDRASLLAAVAEAASAVAAGAELPESVRSLDGRQFEMRIRFGCRGPTDQLREGWLGWSYDAEARRIQVRAMPTISKRDPFVGRLSGEAFEAVEGFWIPRPWLLQPLCPATAAIRDAGDRQAAQDEPSQRGPQPAPNGGSNAGSGDDSAVHAGAEPAPQDRRIGIAQFYTENDPRTGRRDMRPYEARHTLPEGKAISSQGYNLVLAGRLRALPGAGVINCSARGPDSPPECIVSAEFLRVWIEQPETREVIAQWGGG